MPPFGQARRTRSSPRAVTMSAFALGPAQVRRSGYGAMQLVGPYAFGRHLTGHRPSACFRPRSPPESITAWYYALGVVNGQGLADLPVAPYGQGDEHGQQAAYPCRGGSQRRSGAEQREGAGGVGGD